MVSLRKTFCIILLLLCSTVLIQAACAETIGQVKSLPLGAPVVVSGVVTWIKGFECYVESQDRAAGIWVQGSTIGINLGDKVTVAGTLAMDSYELVIAESAIYPSGQAAIIAPFGMPNKGVAGAYAFEQFRVQDRVAFKIPGDGIGYRWDYAGGAPNVGMLVKTWGRVVSTYYSVESDIKYFYIDDGSGVTADLGDKGILVYSSAGVKQGDVVSVTGVSSVELAFDQPDKLIRVIRPRNVADVEVLHSPERVVGFSDEFDGTEIDPRWAIVPGPGSFAVESGNLVLTPQLVDNYSVDFRITLAQLLPDNYDLDVKVVLDFSDDPVYQAQAVSLSLVSSIGGKGQLSNRTSVFTAERYSGLGDIIFIGYPNNPNYMPLPNNSFLFHLSRRGNTTTGRISYDGVTYSQDYTMTGQSTLVIYALATTMQTNPQPTDQFKAYIDYIRITPVNE